MEVFKQNKTYDFMSHRVKFLALSIVVIAVGLILNFTKGLNFGIDFTGGTVVQIQYEEKAPMQLIRDVLKKEGISASVSKFGSDREVLVKISKSSSKVTKDFGDEIRVLLKDSGKFKIRRVDIVGPKVGNELRVNGMLALIISMIVILVYVSFRFEYKFALGAICALIHDVTIAIGALSLFDIEINLDILAALLTIIGYSLNDTIIVYDRIREGIRVNQSKDLNVVINTSISQTLSRTTLTSLTTFFVVLTLYLFGGEIINGFALTLLVGIVVGTYSSIFVASSFLVYFKFSISDFREREYQALKRKEEKERLRALYDQGRL